MVEANEAMGLGIGVEKYLSLVEEPVMKGLEETPAPAEETEIHGIEESMDLYRLEEPPSPRPAPSFQNQR